jgi:hypothetical protein
MSEIDQEIIAVLTKGSNGHSIVFMWRNDTSDGWQFEYDVNAPVRRCRWTWTAVAMSCLQSAER